VGEEHVIGAVRGDVDSSVPAALLQKAIGPRFHAILVDNGCLRKSEAQRVVHWLRDHLGINLLVVDAADRFLDGMTEPEKKRKTIGSLFIEMFQEEAKIEGEVQYLLQGTLYPDVIASISYKGPSATIKTHHNVGGLSATMQLKLIEPLRELFKDEVREASWLRRWASQHPFPGPFVY
jgi:GMP synthase (glutamine-hydrolysing)